MTDYPERDFVKWPLGGVGDFGSGPLTGPHWGVLLVKTPERRFSSDTAFLLRVKSLHEVTHEDMLKIATLNMFKRGEDVWGVGYRSKYSENHYYIY